MTYLASHVLGSRRNGLNHVSMNLGDFNRVSGPVRGNDYPTYSDALLDWYQTKHVSSVRLLFTWEAVQSALGGPVPPAAGLGYANYWADLAGVVTRLLARGIYVILGPWQFNTASGDTDIVYDDAAFTPANFADFWGKFATAINGVTANSPRVAFDLINEPHTHAESGNRAGDIGVTLATWFACAQSAITAIRGAGATNTIFVPGMAYAAASSFTTNGSATEWLKLTDALKNIAVTAHCYTGLGSTNVAVLRNACSALVAWARSHGLKVNFGEMAINAGANGRPAFCGTFANAAAQWADWNAFNAANNDVIVGWNWFGNSAADWWNEGDSCDPEGFHWGLTLDDGASQTVYMNLIESTIPVPTLQIRDNSVDAGAEPNVTTTIGYESPDIWVRQDPDGGTVGQVVQGGQPATVYVKVSNRGLAPSDDNEIVHLYWAKAEAGLSWPKPWDGSNARGGDVAASQAVGVILPGQTKTLPFNWAATPNPVDFGNDGHFCLLAIITNSAAPAFPEFEGSNLNTIVLELSNVAWCNIHISPTAKKEMGDLVVSNHSDKAMLAQVGFEVLDENARITRAAGSLVLTPKGAALDKIRQRALDTKSIEDLGQGRFRIVNVAEGLPPLDLAPGESLLFGVEYRSERETQGHAVRATQFAIDGGSRRTIGGQTFVVGKVAGFSTTPSCRGKGSCAMLIGAGATLLFVVGLLFKRRLNAGSDARP